MATADDQIVATRVRGGPPLVSRDGAPVVADRVTIAEFSGKAFDLVRNDAEAIVAFMGKDSTWWDVGPDSGYVSVVITLAGKTNTVNSWYPLFKDKDTIAIVNGSLVAVNSKEEKQRREAQNDEKHKALMKFMDKIMETTAPTTGGTIRR